MLIGSGGRRFWLLSSLSPVVCVTAYSAAFCGADVAPCSTIRASKSANVCSTPKTARAKAAAQPDPELRN